MPFLADSSFVIAIASSHDKWHQRCEATYLSLTDIVYVPQPTLAEIAHLVTKVDGNRAFLRFLKGLRETKYRIIGLADEDIQRTIEILEDYSDTRLDFVDASIMAVAERLNITRILTVDRRDFQIVRPKHVEHFEVLP